MKRLLWVTILIEFVKSSESANHCSFPFLGLVVSFRFYLLGKERYFSIWNYSSNYWNSLQQSGSVSTFYLCHSLKAVKIKVQRSKGSRVNFDRQVLANTFFLLLAIRRLQPLMCWQEWPWCAHPLRRLYQFITCCHCGSGKADGNLSRDFCRLWNWV